MQLINFRNLFLCLFVAVSASSKAQNKLPQLGRNPVSEIVKAMTLEEKASLVVGTGLRMAGGNAPVIGETVGAPRMAPELVIAPDVISRNADDPDIAIFTISRNPGEGADRKLNGDFNVSDTEKVAIKNIADAFHAKGKKLIVLLNIGGAIETASWRNDADAILLVWQPGINISIC